MNDTLCGDSITEIAICKYELLKESTSLPYHTRIIVHC